MSTPLFGSSSSHKQSGLFKAPSAPSSSHHGHGLLGSIVHAPLDFTGHLLGDVRDAAVGLPEGMVMLATHPVRGLEQIGKTTWQDWSPLFHGHPLEFASHVYAHPLAPILDVASVITGGAGLAARGGEGLAALGAISKESRLAQLSGKLSELDRAHAVEAGDTLAESKLTKVVKVPGAPPAYRHLSSNPVVRIRQEATYKLGKHLSEVAPNWFGRTAEIVKEDGRVGTTSQGIKPQDLNKVREIQTGKIRDFTDEGFTKRYMAKQHSLRGGSLKAMQAAQLAAFVKAGEDITKRPAQIAKAVMDNGRHSFVTHAFRVSAEDARVLKNGLTFVADRPTSMGAVHTVEDFNREIENFGNKNTTSDIQKALRDPKTGDYLVVQKRLVSDWTDEARRSSTFLTKLYKYPTATWKYLILATRPAYFVNNAVGNTFMTMATLGPVGFARGLVDAFRQVHGERAAVRSLEGASKALRKELPIDFQSELLTGIHEGFAHEAMSHFKLHEKIKGHPRTALVVKHAEQGFYPVTHQVADLFLRRVMINSLMRRDLRVRELTASGMKFDRAARQVLLDPAMRDKVHEMVNHALGDYHHFNKVEKQLRQLVPFYSWDRAIMRHGIHLTLDQTPKAGVGVAVGQSGTKETERLLGQIPSFLKGALVLPGHGKAGRVKVLSTLGLNPYATIPDITDTAGALAGVGSEKPSEALASQLNPIITSLIEQTTGQSLLSGAKLPHRGGLVTGTASAIGESLPQVKLLETLIKGEPHPKRNKRTGKVTNFLYRKDARTQIAALMGVPVKELDKARADAMGREELGIKTHHKRRKSHAGLF